MLKSYIHRGRLSARQKQALSQPNPHLIEPQPCLLEFDTLFPESKPIVLEIGFGMGDTLLAMAQQQPDRHFIGIEVHRPGVGQVLAQLETQPLNNLWIIPADAVFVLQQMIPAHSLEKIQLFFPDPWPKRRHHKRRLIQPPFLNLCHAKLIAGGELHLATDWQPYAEHMRLTLENSAGFKNNYQGFAPQGIDRLETKFERRGKQLGHHVWEINYRTYAKRTTLC